MRLVHQLIIQQNLFLIIKYGSCRIPLLHRYGKDYMGTILAD